MATRKDDQPQHGQQPARRIPKFSSYEEEAAFWDQHSLNELAAELTPVKRVKVNRPLERHLSVRLDGKLLDELAGLAERKGIGPSTLTRMWIIEHREQERARARRGVGGNGDAAH